MKRMLSLPNMLFLVFLLLEYLPARRAVSSGQHLLWLLIATAQLYYLGNLLLRKEFGRAQTIGDVTAIFYVVVVAWEASTTRFNLLDQMLYPTPQVVLTLIASDFSELLKGLRSSLQLLVCGYLSALVTAVPLALVIGWRKRLYNVVNPVTKVLGPIPPIVYIPYAIAILPTFKLSSMFIIFIGAFWPIFINTLNGVFNVDKKLIDSAKVLNVSEGTMLFKIILPGTLPAIISGSNIGLVLSFILLTAAEMIGATSGLGWYIKYFSDFADYPRVIVGIIFIGMVVTVITLGFDRIEKRLLRWRA